MANYPEKIYIEIYPETHSGYEYTKDYEYEGGCYYKTNETDDLLYGSFISLHPDESLSFLWNGTEQALNKEWKEI